MLDRDKPYTIKLDDRTTIGYVAPYGDNEVVVNTKDGQKYFALDNDFSNFSVTTPEDLKEILPSRSNRTFSSEERIMEFVKNEVNLSESYEIPDETIQMWVVVDDSEKQTPLELLQENLTQGTMKVRDSGQWVESSPEKYPNAYDRDMLEVYKPDFEKITKAWDDNASSRSPLKFSDISDYLT